MLNYNTTYHSSIGCEPSKVFHGRIPYNVLDHKLGNNPNKNFLPTTEFAEELQQRTQILIDQTKKNIMQSYLKYKESMTERPRRLHHKKKTIDLFFNRKRIVKALKYHLETSGGLVLLLLQLQQQLHSASFKHQQNADLTQD